MPASQPRRAAPRKTSAKVTVKRSSAGLGLFAQEPIRRGDFVIEYKGPLLPDEKAAERDTKYLYEINSRWTIDGSPRRNTARYINHSCRPNCEPYTSGYRVNIYAKRAIKPGEELTYDYGAEYWEYYIKPKGCKCEKCRG